MLLLTSWCLLSSPSMLLCRITRSRFAIHSWPLAVDRLIERRVLTSVATGTTRPKQRAMPLQTTMTTKSLLSPVRLSLLHSRPRPLPQYTRLTSPLTAPSASKKRKTTKDAAPAADGDDEDDDDEEPAGEDDDEVDPAELEDEEEAADPEDEDADEDADDTADKSGPAAAAKKAKERNTPGGKDKAEVGDIDNADEKDGGL